VGCSSPMIRSLGLEPVGGWTSGVCDAWPVPCQTHGYLPSRRTLRVQLCSVIVLRYVCDRQTDRQTDALIVVFRSLSRLRDSFECIGAI